MPTLLAPDLRRMVTDLGRRVGILERRVTPAAAVAAAATGAGGGIITVASVDTPAERAALATYQCDGTADDVEIQAAIDATADGGMVVLLDGEFQMSATVDIGQSLLHGSGLPTTVYYSPANGATDASKAFVVEAGTIRDLAIVCTTKRGGAIELAYGGVLDNVQIAQTEATSDEPTIWLHGSANLVSRCAFYAANATGTPLVEVGSGDSYSRIQECYFSNGPAIHILADGEKTLIADCVFFGGYEYGISLSGEGEIVTGNLFEGIGGDGTGILVGSNNAVITNNLFDAVPKHGIDVFGASRCLIHDNRIHGVGVFTDATYDGIHLRGSADYNSIQGNRIYRGIAAAKTRYGINISASTCDGNLVTCNDLLEGGTTGALNDAGTGTVTAAANRI